MTIRDIRGKTKQAVRNKARAGVVIDRITERKLVPKRNGMKMYCVHYHRKKK